MTDFQTVIPNMETRDASRRVNYALGMVLGVDEFEQEYAYLSGRDKAIVRDLIGYGTIEGLDITLDFADTANGPQVMVSAGSAVNPQGQFIRVKDDQCAYLNRWLAAQKTRLIKERYTAAGASQIVPVYVKLCYRECLTDSVPLPDQPCRSEDAALVPSRITDDYELLIDFDPPDQREERELRVFIQWLNSLPVQDGGADPMTSLADFAALIRAHLPEDANADQAGTQPPTGTVPDITNVRLPLAELPEYLRVAFREWVTALRPARLGAGQDAAGKPPVEECVLLARLDLHLQDNTGGGTPGVDDRGGFSIMTTPPPGVKPDASARPYVLHLRAIQEQLLYAQSRLQVPLDGDVTGPLDANEVQMLRRMPLDYTSAAPPTDGQVLVARPSADGGMQWTPETPTAGIPAASIVEETAFGQASAVGVSTDYARADHTHGTPALPDLAGDVSGPITNTKVDALKTLPLAYDPTTVSSGQVLQLEPIPAPVPGGPQFQWSAKTLELGGGGIDRLDGDVVNAPSDNTLDKIQGVPLKIDRRALKPYSILRFNGEVWTNVLYAPIVASGYALPLGDIFERQPVPTFGDLRLAVTGEGELLASFATYKRPDNDRWSYTVKALGTVLGAADNFPVVAFGEFRDEGFTLFVHNVITREPMPADILKEKMRFMIEVTQIGIIPGAI